MEWIKHWKHLTLTFLKIVEGTIRELKEIASWLRNSFRKVQFEFFRHSLRNSLKSEQFDVLLYSLQNRTFLELFNQYPTWKKSNRKQIGCFGGNVWQSNCEKDCCSMKKALSFIFVSCRRCHCLWCCSHRFDFYVKKPRPSAFDLWFYVQH